MHKKNLVCISFFDAVSGLEQKTTVCGMIVRHI